MIEFSRLTGYQRVAAVLAIAWIVVGTTIYISSLGHYEIGPTYWDKVSIIVAVWEKVCAFVGIPVFGVEYGPGTLFAIKFFENTFHPLGFILFLLIPGALLVLAVFALNWINAGFRREQ